ncbi:MAG: hypothetical protein ABIH39_01420 [Candidatus Margulisiibacteriota bacterium]
MISTLIKKREKQEINTSGPITKIKKTNTAYSDTTSKVIYNNNDQFDEAMRVALGFMMLTGQTGVSR